jgi:hypothetical protein
LFGLDETQLKDAWPRVDAEAKIKPDKDLEAKLQESLTEKSDDDSETEESSDSEDEEGGDEKKREKKKEKIGFRDRKVMVN